MSTKNLSRTAIEGGRTRGNCWTRRRSNRLQRSRERDALVHAALEAEVDDVLIRPRQPLWKDFRDKLSPPRRWLERQVGRPWRIVRGELLRKFDTRTTAGRHLVFDHMLDWVAKSVDEVGCLFAVDARGILRRRDGRWRYQSTWLRDPLPRPEAELGTWLHGRRVGARGEVLFWFTPTAAGGYRQHTRLGEDDAALWRSLPDWFRACHDPSAAPARPASRVT